MEIAWDYEGRYVGHCHRTSLGTRRAPYADLERTRAIKRKRLTRKRQHQCHRPEVFDKLGIDRQALTIGPMPGEHGGCGVFICSTCKQPTPWCMGMSESTECDYCAPIGDDA